MKSRKLILVAGLIAGMGISVIAEPVIKDVKALFNPTIKYTLDGEEILEGKGALVVDGSIYMPLRDAASTLGFDVDYKEKTVILSAKEEVEELEEVEEAEAVEETVEEAEAEAEAVEETEETEETEEAEDAVEEEVTEEVEETEEEAK